MQRGRETSARGFVDIPRFGAHSPSNLDADRLAGTHMVRLKIEEGQIHAREALTMSRDSGNRRGEAIAMVMLGNSELHRGDLREAEDYFLRAIDLSRAGGINIALTNSLNNLGVVYMRLGKQEPRKESSVEYYNKAKKLYEESLELAREHGNRLSEGQSLSNLGTLARKLGDPEESEKLLRDALTILREIGDRENEGITLASLGNNALQREDYEEAERFYREKVRIDVETAGVRDEWLLRNGYTDPDAAWDFPPPEQV